MPVGAGAGLGRSVPVGAGWCWLVPVPVPVPVLPGAARFRPVPTGAGAADGPQETLYLLISRFLQFETRFQNLETANSIRVKTNYCLSRDFLPEIFASRERLFEIYLEMTKKSRD